MSSSAPSASLDPTRAKPSSDEVRFVEPKHRGLRALAAACVVVSVLGVGAARDGARRADQLKCWGTLRNTARGDAWACEAQSERWLGIASTLPWTRSNALKTRADLRIRAAELELFVATRGQPSRERRSVAAIRLLERGELTPAASAALQSGAYPELVAFANQYHDRLDPMGRDLALNAALIEVNSAALRRLLATAPGRELPGEPQRTVALACALLPQSELRPWLDSVEGRDPALSEACGGVPHPQPVELELTAEQRLSEVAGQLSELSPKQPVAVRARLALSILAPRSTHPERTRLEPPRWYAPGDVLLPLPVAVSSEALDAAATQLDVILDTDLGPALEAGADTDPSGKLFPKETLERGRLSLRMYALAVALRQGKHELARTQLSLASSRAIGGFELSLAAAHLALREPRAALRLNQRHRAGFGASTSLEESAQRSLQQAYAENELGDRAAAYLAALRGKRLCDASKSATQLAQAGEEDGGQRTSPVSGCADVEWALAATSIAARQLKALPEPLDLNKLVTGDIQVESGSLDLWRTLAITPEAARRPLRVRLRRPAVSSRWQAFGYQLAGEVVRDAGEVDVWLDASAGQHRPGALLAYFVARASAARWRGDAEADRNWQARAGRATALGVDARTSYLLAQAGL
ncbi:MAG: hypothetical protein AB7K71_14480 [Polyangiaceae bacterium]